jgi:TolA-binding protein
MTLVAAALLSLPQEGEVERIMLKFQQRRAQVTTIDQFVRLVGDTRSELERFLKQYPAHRDSGRATFHVAEMYLWAQETQAGIDKLRQVLKDFPAYERAADVRFLIAEILLHQIEDDAAARAAFEEFAKMHPQDERALSARLFAAITLQNEKKYDEATAALRAVRAEFKDRKESWSAVTQIAIIQHLREQPDESRRTLESLVRECPEAGPQEIARRHLSEYLAMGKDAPAAAATDALGQSFSLEKLRGKVVVVYFFDSTLPNSDAEAAFLRKARDAFKGKDLELAGVSINLERKDYEQFKEKHQIDWPTYYDGKGLDGKLARLWNVRGLPSLWVVDRRGKFRFFNIAGKDLRNSIEKLLQEK